MKKILFILLSAIVILAMGLYGYDIFRGQKRTPRFYAAPKRFCETYWRGITLPPIGMFVCESNGVNERLRSHELVHWEQYRRTSTLGFYARYVYHWIRAGFSYEKNLMEVEARQKTSEAFDLR